ncbi:MAG: hypothetical protein AAFR44_06000, partial [Pseudomonadota bacterium]
LGDAEVAAFLAGANPEAYAAMQARFRALDEAGLWETRRNSIRATLLEPLQAPVPEAITEAGE